MMQEHPAFGTPESNTPFVMTGNRLYLRRYYRLEQEVAERMISRNKPIAVADTSKLKDMLDLHFGNAENNRQKLAALLAISRQSAIVTGGPGTGKTSTVVKMLDILLQEAPDTHIKLAAPTGKAAMRLSESIQTWAENKQLELEVQTLHRLLGMRRDGRSWRHGPQNPISADLLIVDEASMIDLPMMNRLLGALNENTRLILLGDPDQLPSVDTGNVLADLCAGQLGFSTEFSEFAEPFVGKIPDMPETHALTDAICNLEQSYRFNRESAIGRLASTIRQGGAEVDESDINDSDASVNWSTEINVKRLLQPWHNYLETLRSSHLPARELLTTFEQARILCSRRGGDWGVMKINEQLEALLETEELKQPDDAFYPGRPVLITRNDYNLGVFNGDIGICTPMEDGEYLVNFPGRSEGILASRLPAHETCFAMTVHKAQGSEFDHVMLLLDTESSEEASSLLTRELVYTAVTRARKSVDIFSTKDTWEKALKRRSRRISGMTRFLGIADHPSDRGQLDLF